MNSMVILISIKNQVLTKRRIGSSGFLWRCLRQAIMSSAYLFARDFILDFICSKVNKKLFTMEFMEIHGVT
jgi:hypothetical protein